MKEKAPRDSFSRREFLTVAAAGTGLGMTSLAAATGPSPVSPPRRPSQQSVFGLKAPPLSTVRVGFIGIGSRGSGLLDNLLNIEGVAIKAVCDLVPERVKGIQQRIVAKGQPEPAGYSKNETDFENLCRREDIDVVYIATPWDWHVRMAVSAMKNGKHAMTEVPAAITLDECWQLVDTAEQTQRHCMMLENCCYGESELLVLSIARQGVFGELIHGEAGYLHELRDFFWQSSSATNWRRRFTQRLNGNLYPTHGLGPVAQCLGINGGDRFDYLVSMSSTGTQSEPAARRLPRRRSAPARADCLWRRQYVADQDRAGADDPGAVFRGHATALQPNQPDQRHPRHVLRLSAADSSRRACRGLGDGHETVSRPVRPSALEETRRIGAEIRRPRRHGLPDELAAHRVFAQRPAAGYDRL